MSKNDRLRNLRDALAEVEEAKRNLIVNGQMYSIQGSHSVTSADYRILQQREREIRSQIMRARGCNKRYNYAGIGSRDEA